MKYPPEMSEQEFVEQVVWHAAYDILSDVAGDQNEAADAANAIMNRVCRTLFPEG